MALKNLNKNQVKFLFGRKSVEKTNETYESFFSIFTEFYSKRGENDLKQMVFTQIHIAMDSIYKLEQNVWLYWNILRKVGKLSKMAKFVGHAMTKT